MRVGLIDVDAEHFGKPKFPNLALMKLSAWHKAQGDEVEWWWGFTQYDRVYMSRVFDDIYVKDIPEPVNAKEIVKGGSGYVLRDRDGVLRFNKNGIWVEATPELMSHDNVTYNELLQNDVEHIYPDYSLYPKLTENYGFGFLTRGCPKACHFCVVAGKEGRRSVKVADLSEWWRGQKNIVLMDPNLLAYRGHMDLIEQMIESKAWVDVNQGFDCRLLTEQNIEAINRLKLNNIHFAWDYMKYSEQVLAGLELYRGMAKHKVNGAWGAVYVLTNYDTTMEENLYRIYTLRDMGYDPYVMVYDKPNAPKDVLRLQRWCNSKFIFKSCPNFEDYQKEERNFENAESYCHYGSLY